MSIFDRWLPQKRDTSPPTEKTETEIFQEQLGQVVTTYAEWVTTNLGIETTTSALLGKIDVLEPEAFHAYMIATYPNIDPKNYNGLHVAGHYSFKEGRVKALRTSEPDQFQIISHEIGHLLSDNRKNDALPTNPDQVLTEQESWIKAGYEIKDPSTNRTLFRDLNEAVVQMLNLEVLGVHRDKSQIDHIGDADLVAYRTPVIILDSLIKLAADRLQLPAKDIRFQLYRGLLTGETDGLKILQQALGENIVTILSESSYFGTSLNLEKLVEASFEGQPTATKDQYRSNLLRAAHLDIGVGFQLFEDLQIRGAAIAPYIAPTSQS